MLSYVRQFFTQAADAIATPPYPWFATRQCPLVLTMNVHQDAAEFPIVLEGRDIWIDLGDGKGFRPVCTDTEKHTNAQCEYVCKYDPYELLTPEQIQEWEEAEDERDGWSSGWSPVGQRTFDIKIFGQIERIEFDWKMLPGKSAKENSTVLLGMRWGPLPSMHEPRKEE